MGQIALRRSGGRRYLVAYIAARSDGTDKHYGLNVSSEDWPALRESLRSGGYNIVASHYKAPVADTPEGLASVMGSKMRALGSGA